MWITRLTVSLQFDIITAMKNTHSKNLLVAKGIKVAFIMLPLYGLKRDEQAFCKS